MNGKNEIITVKLPDNTFQSQNAGATRHQGVEYGINYRPAKDIYMRLSGTNTIHKFTNYVAGGIDYSGYEMAAAPHFFGNTERSEEHTSELQSLMRISYAVFCLNKKKTQKNQEYY